VAVGRPAAGTLPAALESDEGTRTPTRAEDDGGEPAPSAPSAEPPQDGSSPREALLERRLTRARFALAGLGALVGVFRVLVGPVAEADVNKIRTDLQNASFPGKDAIKRTF